MAYTSPILIKTDLLSMKNFYHLFLIISVEILLLMACVPATIPQQENMASATFSNALPVYDALQALSEKLIDSSRQYKIGKIAVANFSGSEGNSSIFGDYISDKISVRLFSSGIFPDFMERKQLKQIVREMQKEHGPIFDEKSVKKFGKMIGVDSMVVGSIEDLGAFFDITAKIVNSETGRLQGIAEVQMLKADIENIIHNTRLANLTINVSPPVSGNVVINGLQSKLKYGIAVISGLPFGDYPLIIQPEGLEAIRKSISITQLNETFGYEITESYEVTFQIIPFDASLYVDGNKIELTQQGFAKIPNLKNRTYSYVVSAKNHEGIKMDSFNPVNTGPIKINLSTKDPFLGTRNKFSEIVQALLEKQDFKLHVWTDKPSYKIGDTINFSFVSEKDCFLNIYDINSDGEITQLFPNHFNRDNRVKGGKTYNIPADYGFELFAQKPAGQDWVYAVASTQPINLLSNDFDKDLFTAVTRNDLKTSGLKGIGSKLKTTNFSSATSFSITIY